MGGFIFSKPRGRVVRTAEEIQGMPVVESHWLLLL